MPTLFIKCANGRYAPAPDHLVLESAASYRAERFVGQPIANPRASVEFLRQQLQWREAECFCALWLDNRHRVLAFDEMFQGTIDGASVHPREVVKRGLTLNAAAVIFAHNHPSGVADPSMADEHITRRLKEALALIDMRVLDHIVVGASLNGEPAPYASFADRGLL
jgi:DNA repair protein RadC